MQMTRMVTAAFLALTATLAASGQETFLPHPQAILHSFPGTLVYPESIAIDQTTGTLFVGSVKDGTIFKGQVGTSTFDVFSPAGADGRLMATGMFHRDHRLVVAGRQTGLIFIYDTQDGRLITKLDNGRSGTDQTFLNDVTFAPDGSAYVTDSVNAVLYRVGLSKAGQYKLEEFLKYEGTPIRYVTASGAQGININGLVTTADGRYLILAKRNEHALYRVDLRTKQIVPVTMAKDTLNTPDGMFLQGTMLYVAQNLPKSVAVLTFTENFTRAALARTIRHPTFAFPTSVARFEDKLFVVSAQFNTAGSPAAVTGNEPPLVPFWVTELPLSE